jgi:hypothetical protein
VKMLMLMEIPMQSRRYRRYRRHLRTTASSENFSAKSIENSNTISISAGIKSREAKPALPALSAPPASFVNEAAPSEDIYFDAADKKTPSENFSNFTNAPITESAVEHVAAAIVVSEKTNVATGSSSSTAL